MKLTIIKFLVGGLAVLISYIVSVVLPWKEFGGIFATFPAVFLVSMCISGMQYGNKVAMHVSRGAVFGMTGVLFSILATWAMLNVTHMWIKCVYCVHLFNIVHNPQLDYFFRIIQRQQNDECFFDVIIPFYNQF